VPRKIKYKVRISRLVEEECEIYMDADCPETAEADALDIAEEVTDTIWLRSDGEPHTYTIESVKLADPQAKEEFKNADKVKVHGEVSCDEDT
jgi:hypothetical protein